MSCVRSHLSRAFFVLCLMSAACSEDPPADKSNSNDDEDEDNGSPGGNKKDAGRDAGKDAGRTDAARPALMTIPCGSKTCPQLPSGLGIQVPTACCYDEDVGSCSTEDTDGTCKEPAEVDDRCPAVTVFGRSLEACCTEENQCGINASTFGMGCQGLDSPTLAMIPNVSLPAPRACDAEPTEEEPDAGAPVATTDAGKTDAGRTDAGGTDAGRADAGRDAGR